MAYLRTTRHALLAAAIVTLALAHPAWAQVAGTSGIKGGERFAETGEDTVEALVDAETHLRTTLDAYNTLVTKPTKDAKGDYKKLLKNLDNAKKKIALVKPRLDTMNGESENYFRLWESQVAEISDGDLKARGEERIASTRKEYESILTSLRESATTLDPFLRDLADQINFLGSDLRPEALESLKGNAEKLNNTGKTLFGQTGATVTKSNAFFEPLKDK
jgi:ElaB/YqjD/DUF883 family membrane-anchored ribosome-binding protein